MDERTEQPAEDPVVDAVADGVASPVPPIMFWMLWISVFAAVAWGLMLLFGRRPWDGTSRYDPEPERPVEEPTLDHID